MGRKKPPVRRAPSIKLRESSNSSQGSPVDPYRQTSTRPSVIHTETEDSEESSTEAKAKLKDLLDGIVAVSSKYSTEPEPMSTEQTVTPANSTYPPKAVVGNSTDNESTESEELTFWKQVTDSKSNSVYYWNPKTNKVSWVLPNNGVIADDTPDNPVPEEFSMEPEADNPYAEYYAYYKQHYVQADTATPEVEESVPNQAKVQSNDIKKPKPGTESKTAAGTGPRLPSALGQTTSTGPDNTKSGVKRKVSPVKEADGLDPASKKVRVKSKTSDSKSPPNPQAEQALRFQVSNMADEFTRKLGYLHVTNEGLSEIQLLSIQLQTRLSDWKEGGLTSNFMLSKLKSFSNSLLKYEDSAAPDGWKIVWDSSSCRYQYHNLSTGETTWEYPIQQTDSTEMLSSQEESSDNAESPMAPSQRDDSSQHRVIGPIIPPSLTTALPPPGPPQDPPMEPVSQPQTTVEESNQHSEVNTTSMIGPSIPPTVPPTESQSEPATVKSQSAYSPDSPTSNGELTLQKVRQKLYPSLRPQRSRESVDDPVLPPVIPEEVPPVLTNNYMEEPKAPLVNREGVELISEYPPPSEEKVVSKSPVKSSKAFDVGVIQSKHSSVEPVPPPTKQPPQQSTAESEVYLRKRLLERHQIKFSVTPKEKNEESLSVANQPKPSSAASPVEAPSVPTVDKKLENSQENITTDESRVEPETGAVEAQPGLVPTQAKNTGQDTSSSLYQNWTPSPTDQKEGEKSQFSATVKDDDDEVSSESSPDSESASEKETKCYMDMEESKSKSKSRRKSSKRGHRRDDYNSDSDHDRYSDGEYSSSHRHKSSKHSRRDYSSDESGELRSYKRSKHKSHRYDDSDDEYSRRRSSRSSHHSSKKNRSRSRSGHRRKRSYSKDSRSPHSSERTKTPKHKKVKKEKKKKSHKSEKHDKKEEEDTPKPPPNVIVGKVGRISTQRTLGKDKKPEDKTEDKPETPKASLTTAQQPQTISATYYQQPTTGEVPYYYYQGYYDPNSYQWGGQQGAAAAQWYNQDGAQATSGGAVQYPSQYTSNSQYTSSTTTTAPHPVSTQTAQSTPSETLTATRVLESGDQVPSTEVKTDTASASKNEVQVNETGETEPRVEEPSEVTTPQVLEPASREDVGKVPADSVVVPTSASLDGKPSVSENRAEEITECDMEIDNTPSPPTPPPKQIIQSEPVSTEAVTSVDINQEHTPPTPPILPESSEPSYSVSEPSTENNVASDNAATPPSVDVVTSTVVAPSGTPPISAPPTSEVATTSTDYSSYMLANQQQQAYSYAYATNNYVQAAYNAYVQQANAAYQAYGTTGYYPGYGTQPATTYAANMYGAGYYGSATTDVTTPTTSGGYGKVAYQLAQQAANTSTSDSADSKKSEFALAGNKSKQMKNMMDKWSSFQDKEDS